MKPSNTPPGRVKPYKCVACKKKFLTKETAERHINRQHDGCGIITWEIK